LIDGLHGVAGNGAATADQLARMPEMLRGITPRCVVSPHHRRGICLLPTTALVGSRLAAVPQPNATPSSTSSTLRVRLHAGARQFLTAAEPLLRSDPFSTNVMAVVASRIAAGQESDSAAYLWATVTASEGRVVVGAAMHTPPQHVFVSRMPAQAAATLAHALAEVGRAVPGVNGAVEATRPFAATWTAVSGQPSILITATRLYRLRSLTRPRGVPGQAVAAATPGDIDLMAIWLAAFHAEAQPEAPPQDWRALAERRITAGQVHLWQDDGVFVSLAAVSAPAVGVARVGPVYTPPASRRRGYGAAVTAHATATALATGAEHVVLYTDLANPTSNSIYQQIGFAADHDAEERAFR
jgi:predicted GNAT family acetyltransferase